jgi:uncharacterized protein (TIGR02246 family)
MSQATAGAPTSQEIADLHERIARSWQEGSGEAFSAGFTADAHFVAFDGTVLRGPDAIARFHQRAFDTHLKGTRLVVSIEETAPVGDHATLAFTTGHIERDGAGAGDLTGQLVQTGLFVRQDGKVLMKAFHDCRNRPITDQRSAEVWKAFDRAWKAHAPE